MAVLQGRLVLFSVCANRLLLAPSHIHAISSHRTAGQADRVSTDREGLRGVAPQLQLAPSKQLQSSLHSRVLLLHTTQASSKGD